MNLRLALQYGLRSLRRHPRRTTLTVGAVALSAAVSIVGARFTEASLLVFKEGVIEFGASHAQLRMQSSWKSQQGLSKDHLLRLSPAQRSAIDADARVSGTSERLKFSAIIANGGKSMYFFGTAFDPERERTVAPRVFEPEYVEGNFVSSAKPDGVVVGRLLAGTLGLAIGDQATIMAQTLDGQVSSYDVEVVGIANPPSTDLSRRLVYMHLNLARQSIGSPEGYTELAVRLSSLTLLPGWIESAKGGIDADVMALAWSDLFPFVPKLEGILRSITGFASILLLLAAGIAVLNIVYLTVEERTVEIGTLMALGARPREIWLLFVAEAALIGAAGGLLGAVVANVIVVVAGAAGVPFQNPFSSGLVHVYPRVSLMTSAVVVVAAITICWLAALLPALKSTRIDPVAAFRRLAT